MTKEQVITKYSSSTKNHANKQHKTQHIIINTTTTTTTEQHYHHQQPQHQQQQHRMQPQLHKQHNKPQHNNNLNCNNSININSSPQLQQQYNNSIITQSLYKHNTSNSVKHYHQHRKSINNHNARTSACPTAYNHPQQQYQ